jgi:valyl-tRNA synthetase
MTIDKTFDPAAIEAKWYAHWESTGAFRPDRPHAEPYTIVNPPPNVTGSLHIGHALDNTLQDILIRHARLQGKDALWVVGMDHAGIATQMVVERQLNAQGQKRTDFTRDEFVTKVWEWKAESGGEITGQLRRLGCSMDWENERFTMDEGFSKAVIKVFVELYNTVKEDGTRLLYRDKRLVNWDPGLKTAISDLEVEAREINGKFWHFKYPLEDGSGFISVATTRPETMLADMAVAVNPSDERYAHLVGKNVRLPITGRLIPIITDEHADPELGSGAVKITPGHDFNDFEVGRRAGFKASDMFNMLDGEGRVVQTADRLIPAEYIGQYRFGIEGEPTNARKMVVEAMDALDLLEKVEDRVIQTPFGDRSGQVIEPWLTDQWYVDAQTLAKPAIEAARNGKANGGFDIVPKSWEKTYFNWMENIQPWCVSRQLWWGHRIPVWYGPKCEKTVNGFSVVVSASGGANDSAWFEFVCESEQQSIDTAKQKYGEITGLQIDIRIVDQDNPNFQFDGRRSRQLDDETWQFDLYRDPDVLDTWFSSALWPFGTLGWPEALSSPSTCDGEGENPLHQPAAGPPPRSGEESLLQRHYPNDVLISGFDILFFWDARMAMQGIHFMKEVPWKTLYLHGLVRAADGSKMSKSKGNTVDPLGLIDQYGADALRFFMAAMESQGRDIKMDESRVAGYRNFATKLWNAARFAQSNGISGSHSVHAPKAELAVNRWIIGEVVETVEKLNKAFAEYRFDGMADVLYHFVFDQFCDWYLELIKPLVQVRPGEGRGPDAVEAGPQPALGNAEADETREVAGWALDQILVMLHPFMPFITEELWHALSDSEYPRAYDIIHAQWPEPNATVDAEAVAEINWVIDTISKTRSFKAELNIAPGTRLTANIAGPQTATIAIIARQGAALSRLGRIDDFVYSPVETNNVAQIVVGDDTIVFALDGVIDLDAERSRITKAIEAATKERDALSGRLSNAAFVEKAKPEAVEKARADHAEKAAEVERLTAARKRLG